MKYCDWHKTSLDLELNRCGLLNVGSTDPELRAKNTLEGMVRGWTVDNFEPPMCAQSMILLNAADYLATNPVYFVWVMVQEGFQCPLCYLTDLHMKACKNPTCTFHPDDWVALAAEKTLQKYRSLAL